MSRRRRSAPEPADTPFEYAPLPATSAQGGDAEAFASPVVSGPSYHPPSTPVPVVSAGLHVEGDLTIATGAHVHESMQVEGKLHLGRSARLEEAIHAVGDVEVGDDVGIHAALECDGSIRWGRNAEASRVTCRGAFVLDDGVARATSLVARRGVHPGPASGRSA